MVKCFFFFETLVKAYLTNPFTGFEQAIQSYAIHVLSLTYQKVPRPVLAEVNDVILN